MILVQSRKEIEKNMNAQSKHEQWEEIQKVIAALEERKSKLFQRDPVRLGNDNIEARTLTLVTHEDEYLRINQPNNGTLHGREVRVIHSHAIDLRDYLNEHYGLPEWAIDTRVCKGVDTVEEDVPSVIEALRNTMKGN